MSPNDKAVLSERGCARKSESVPEISPYILAVSQYRTLLLGCRQVVRHWVLVPAFGGSNPSIPAKKNLSAIKPSNRMAFCILTVVDRHEVQGSEIEF